MQDCHICLSAGSVNQWGVCEVCCEEVEDAASLVGDFTASRLSLAAEQ